MSIERTELEVEKKPAEQKRQDILFLIWSFLCLLLLISLITYSPDDSSWSVIGEQSTKNAVGKLGAHLADFLLLSVGYLGYALPILIFTKLFQLFRRKTPATQPWLLRFLGFVVIVLSLSGLASLSIWEGGHLPAGAGGITGNMVISSLLSFLGLAGTSLILLFALALGVVLFFEFSWILFFESIGGACLAIFELTKKLSSKQSDSADKEKEGIDQEQPESEQLENQTEQEQEPKQSKKRFWWARKATGGKSLSEKAAKSARDDQPDNHEPSQTKTSVSTKMSARQEPDFNVLNEDDFITSGFADESESIVPSPKAYTPTSITAEAPPVSEPDHATETVVKSIPIEPLEKRSSAPSERAKKDLQGSLFNSDQPLPSIALLDPPRTNQKPGFSPERLQQMSQLLVQKLADFGVKIEVTAVAPGPVITRFEIQPAPGVKASKILNLAKDLARSMAMKSVRVVEVIPGKTVMGIEVPNEDRAVVSLSEVLASQEFDKSKSPLTLALGHDIAGNPIITDLAKMPHLLVAGTTGSGKSVGVNAMLLSLLFKSTPEEVRLILVDPKMLELSVYEGIPHLLTPVITDMKEAASGLRWSVAEMERRYQLMAALGVRNITGYNKKVKEAIEAGQPIPDPLWQITESFDTTPPTLEPLPYIVIVIDEFADMMMMVGKKVEELIARIAQKARAAGIHMILATQRPSVDVITGLIKANVPTRIAFQVSSKIDSRTILDQGGAEQLLGHGDMLFMPPGNALPERVHGAFVDDDEVHRVAAEWKQRGEPDYIEEITQVSEEGGLPGEPGEDAGEQDALFDQAVAFVTQSGKCSISSVQRKLRIGYNRAANLVESMEAAGVVSPAGHNGAREVLAPPPPE